MNTKPIGSINGPWSLMLRFMLATYPLVVAWTIWVTSETFVTREFRQQAVTREEMLRVQALIDLRFSQLPPQDWRDLIKSIASDVKVMGIVVNENQVRLKQIETIMEKKPQ